MFLRVFLTLFHCSLRTLNTQINSGVALPISQGINDFDFSSDVFLSISIIALYLVDPQDTNLYEVHILGVDLAKGNCWDIKSKSSKVYSTHHFLKEPSKQI